MRTLDTDVVMEQAVHAYFSLALEQSAEISRRSTKHRRRRRLRFDRHYTTEPNQTVLAWQLEVSQLGTVPFGSAAFTRRSETLPYRAGTVTNSRVNGVYDLLASPALSIRPSYGESRRVDRHPMLYCREGNVGHL